MTCLRRTSTTVCVDGARTPGLPSGGETLHGLCAAEPRPPTRAPSPVPRFLVWGDRDEVLGRAQQEALAHAIPGSQLLVYENTGHLVLWEQPERVARDLTAFLEGLAQGPP